MKNAPEFEQQAFQENFKQAYSVEYKDSPGSANEDYHTHGQYEVLLCLSDNMFYSVGDERFPIGADSLLLFNSTDLHLFAPMDPQGENRRYVLYFEPSFLTYLSEGDVNLLDCFLFRPFDGAHLMQLSGEQSRNLQEMFEQLIALTRPERASEYGIKMRQLILARSMMLEINVLYRQYHLLDGISNESNRQLVYAVINYINKNFADELRLDTLAQHFYINKYSLCQSFKQVTGITLNQYIINYRLQRAKELLLKGNSVEKVCAQTGFNNLSHFSRQFKAKVGQSPKQFQKEYMNSQKSRIK